MELHSLMRKRMQHSPAAPGAADAAVGAAGAVAWVEVPDVATQQGDAGRAGVTCYFFSS
jgi:hypothetical protein